MKVCGFKGCEEAYRARGLCAGHWRQWRDGEELRPLGGSHLTTEQRFWAKVTKTGDCWLISGSSVGIGHKFFEAMGERLAHRVSWVMHNGPIPDDMVVMHRCDTPACVRPDHLQLGTRADNNRDMVAKGRNTRGPKASAAVLSWTVERRGEMWHAAKLSDLAVEEILSKVRAGQSQAQVARAYGVTQGYVSRLVNGRRRGRS